MTDRRLLIVGARFGICSTLLTALALAEAGNRVIVTGAQHDYLRVSIQDAHKRKREPKGPRGRWGSLHIRRAGPSRR